MLNTTRTLPSTPHTAFMLLFGIFAFSAGESALVGGTFFALFAIYPPLNNPQLGLCILLAGGGAGLATLGVVLMRTASDCLHDKSYARRRSALAGYVPFLRTILVMNGALLGLSGFVCALAGLLIEGFDPYVAALIPISGAVGVLSLRDLATVSDQMASAAFN